ncbi:hypothetical protein FSP39_004244 [Pinctada imbricata]|uniref:Lipocalin/cytosolic fatty-acid binding domain-containing protein n=1 Tax=Pinctada imbricata TaxID=66713 RepID=A0AA88XCJ6_PINIB|nr:hypothetical protein FSP39_004244 [Pinctada imbricata]
MRCSSAFIADTLFGKGPVTVVDSVDTEKYLGHWFQMYGSNSIYLTFERNAYCVTADYSLANDGSGRIAVLNSETLGSGNGTKKVIHGYATPSSTPGKLTVDLEGVLFSAPYWVTKLGPANCGPDNLYQYAVVTDNLRATLFVLARDVQVFRQTYEEEVLQYLKQNGFTTVVNRPVKTYHEQDCQYNTHA